MLYNLSYMHGRIMQMKPTLTRPLMMALALIGLADAAYLTDMAFAGKNLVCNIEGLDGCNTVAQSAYSWVLGFPLAFYGVIFYFLFLAVLLLRKHMTRGWYRTILLVLALAGVAFSTYFVYLQQFVIQALCVYCLGSALLSYLLALIVFFETQSQRAEAAPVADSPSVVP